MIGVTILYRNSIVLILFQYVFNHRGSTIKHHYGNFIIIVTYKDMIKFSIYIRMTTTASSLLSAKKWRKAGTNKFNAKVMASLRIAISEV